MKKSFTLFVSTFSDRNKHLVQWKERAEHLFQVGRNAAAQQEFDDIRRPGIVYLESVFADMGGRVEPIIGMFRGTLEPSIQLTISFDDETEWVEKVMTIKRRLIAFGRIFNQANVHLVDMYAKLPNGVACGGRDLEKPDVTYQKKLWISLKNISHRYLNNFILLERVAREAGIENLTLNVPGSQILIYTVTGIDFTTFDQQCAGLLAQLYEQDLVFSKNSEGNVALTNYGDDGYGETHSYDEATAYLDGLKDN